MARKKRERKDINQRDFTIRPANKEDCGFVRQLSNEVFSIFGDYGEIIPEWFVNPDVITVIYLKKGHSLGFAMLYILSGEILAVAVASEYQRRGIGSALLNYLEGIARQLGIKRLLLHTATENEMALRFFQKAAFKVIGGKEKYYPRGQTALVMSKDIP